MLQVNFPTSNGDRLSGSLFVDYANDVGYVGDSQGNLYKVQNLFCTLSACVSTPVAPSIEWTLAVGSASMTSPVSDLNGHIFISDGTKLYEITDSGSTGAVTSSFTVGSGVIDSPIVSSGSTASQNAVFAFASTGTGTGHTASSVVVQSVISTFPNATTTNIGTSGGTIWAGTFDNTYYYGTPSSGYLYACGGNTSTTAPTLYRIGFTSYPTMDSSIATGPLQISSNAAASCAPLTEIDNAGTDWLFTSVTNGCNQTGGGSGGCLMNFNITSSFPGAATSAVAEAGGTSAIAVDNVSFSSAGVEHIFRDFDR